jgi:hypothetical protein
MSDGVEIGSLVGTWVAAGVAVIALIGVLGPLLVWRTIRTERHKAIDKLTQRGGKTGGYVTTGVRIAPNIRLFRQFEAPYIQSPPALSTPKSEWKDEGPVLPSTSASWVQFGRLLENYHMRFPKTKIVLVQDGQTWLPVHRTWIIIIDLLGRYGIRKDKGKLITKPASGIRSTQARPGASVAFASTPASSNTWRARAPSIQHIGFTCLFGVTGWIYLRPGMGSGESHISSHSIAFFTSHSRGETGEIPSEELDIGQMFWLAVGCLPAPGSRVYSLDDVESIEIEGEGSGPIPMMRSASRFSNDAYTNGPDDGSAYPYTNRPLYPGQPGPMQHTPSANQYVVPNVTPAVSHDRQEARAFRLSIINH